MQKILFSFLPWIAYFLVTGPSKLQHLLALGLALCITLILDRKELQKGFVLTWGGFVFFCGLLTLGLFTQLTWPIQHSSLLGNIALMLIVWVSLLIRKPFTLQYAREMTPPIFWNSKLFIRINEILTSVWGACFTAQVLMSLARMHYGFSEGILYQVITYLPAGVAIFLTEKFPDWYKQKVVSKKIAQSRIAQKTNPFLLGGFEPITQEVDVNNVTVIGQLPEAMEGVYMRNGPNPQFAPLSYDYPYDGDGMIHALYFEKGSVRYKNRFVLTDQLTVERRLGYAVYGGLHCPFILDESKLTAEDPKTPIKTGRFIHVIQHANAYLAMHESTSAYAITRELETVGEWNPTRSEKPADVNAHSRVDPDSGARYFISYSERPEIDYLVLTISGDVAQQGKIAIPRSYMIHDFVTTKNHVVIFLCPAILNIFGENILEWKPEYLTTIIILDKNDLSKPYRTLTTEAFFTFHFANAYEEKELLYVDHVRYEKISSDTAEMLSSCLYRTTIDLNTFSCLHKKLDDHTVEFPRINEKFDSKKYRYIYAACNTVSKYGHTMQAIIKYDLENGVMVMQDFGERYEVDEPIFVPKKQTDLEDEGYVVFYLYDRVLQKSECVILDAKNISAEPLARIQLPQRVPHGLHGSWMS